MAQSGTLVHDTHYFPQTDRAVGLLRFTDVTEEELTKLAQETLNGSDGELWERVVIRPGSRNDEEHLETVIEFTRKLDDSKEKTFKKFSYSLTDKLKRRFGNQVTWDFAGRALIIKK